jgi:hypothetical protein
MAQLQPWQQKRGIIAVIVAVVGIAVGIGMTIKSHDFYDAGRFRFDLEQPQSSFELQPGRYELTYKQELGRLTFEIVGPDGDRIAVDEFDWVTQLFHTQGWRGHVFVASRPGKYQLTVKPWPAGLPESRMNVSAAHTEAIARWSGGGILLSGLSCGLAMMIVLPLVRVRPKAANEPGVDSKVL